MVALQARENLGFDKPHDPIAHRNHVFGKLKADCAHVIISVLSLGRLRVKLLPGRQTAVQTVSHTFPQTSVSSLQRRRLTFFGDLGSLAALDAFRGCITAMQRINWVVYAKRPFGDPTLVLAYLVRYTHRVAIAYSRLVAFDDDHVAFTWKDYRQNSATKIMNLRPDEFIRRFLLHTLPDGFHRIRHFGFMANRHRAAKLALCRSILNHERTAQNNSEPLHVDSSAQTWAEVPASPDCGGVMRIIERFRHSFSRASPRTSPFRCDTSRASSCFARRSSFVIPLPESRSSRTFPNPCGHTEERQPFDVAESQPRSPAKRV
ncbi:IS91 family transposase [Bradyrhizobium campsiandrae]|uniref:IS91 family transposase n=1 Tax=Bradyrhizobium campsiandrae TaxID=1729892 RepID=UPI0035D75871